MNPLLKTVLVALGSGFFVAVAAVFAQLGPAELNQDTLIFALKAGVIGAVVGVAGLFTDKPRDPARRERIDDVSSPNFRARGLR